MAAQTENMVPVLLALLIAPTHKGPSIRHGEYQAILYSLATPMGSESDFHSTRARSCPRENGVSGSVSEYKLPISVPASAQEENQPRRHVTCVTCGIGG